MARIALTGTQRSFKDNDGRKEFDHGGGTAPSTLPSTATVAANIATLVADGATPTQAHVTTLNTNWGTLLTALNAMSVETGDFYFSYDNTKITTLNDLNKALDSIRRQALSAGLK